MFHTIGQRHGLGIGGQRAGSGEPWYVVGKDMEHNLLIVAQGHDHPGLLHSRLQATQFHWIADSPPHSPLRCRAKIRYRQPDQLCELEALDANGAQVRFDQPQRAITPGQAIVFYAGDDCLGGGIIDAALD